MNLCRFYSFISYPVLACYINNINSKYFATWILFESTKYWGAKKSGNNRMFFDSIHSVIQSFIHKQYCYEWTSIEHWTFFFPLSICRNVFLSKWNCLREISNMLMIKIYLRTQWDKKFFVCVLLAMWEHCVLISVLNLWELKCF